MDIDADATTLDGCSLVVTETCNVDIVTPDFELSGGTAWMHGTNLKVEYSNIDITGTTDIDIVSPDIDIDSTNITISGETTTLKGTDLYEYYTNITRTARSVNNTYNTVIDNITNNKTVGTEWIIDYDNWTLSGDTTNMYGDTLTIDYNSINISGDTKFYDNVNIEGDLILNPNKRFTGQFKNDLKFKVATNAVKNSDNTLTETTAVTTYNNSELIYLGENDPLVSKGYVDDIFNLLLDDGKISTAIDSFRELQEVLGVSENGEITGTTYNTVVEGINAKVNRSGDTMTGDLKISEGITLTTSGAITANSDITTSTKFIGNLEKTLTFTGGTFSNQTFNNSNDVTVNIPTDISHLSCTGEPSSWTSLDNRYVNVSGDTMTGSLSISNGGLAVTGASSFNGDMSVTGEINATGAIYSSDKNLKENIKNINKYDIATVADVDLKSYKFINDETHRERYGVIAQDLESVGLEHLVVKGENGKKGVDYISFLILKIAQLEKEIEELKKKK